MSSCFQAIHYDVALALKTSIFKVLELNCNCVYVCTDALPVHSGNDRRRRPTSWWRKTRRRDSNGQPYKEIEGVKRVNMLKILHNNNNDNNDNNDKQ